MPFILRTCGDPLRIARVQLQDRKAFPRPEGDFDEPLFDFISRCRQADFATRDFHRLTCAAKRAADKIEFIRTAAGTVEQAAENNAAVGGLRATAFVERNVISALQTARHVPVGLAVADVIEGRPFPCRRAHYSFLPTVMSGASGCLIPTI